MNKFFFILSLVLVLSAFELTKTQTPECPDEYYFNETCNKCVRCQWDIIDPPNDATFHWCRCNCYQDGQYNIRSDLCFLQGMIWAPPPTGHQECIWRCKGKESTSKNGTFANEYDYLATCNTPIPQCHPTCYHCAPGLASPDSCTECPVGYKLTSTPTGRCVLDYDVQTNTGLCSGDQSCADYTCSAGLIKLIGVDYLPAQDQYCCSPPNVEIFTCAVYLGACPTGFVANPDTYFLQMSYDKMTVATCCLETCSAFTCDQGYALIESNSNLYPASNSVCCQPTCALQNICPSDYIWLSTSPAVVVNQANCCQQICGSSDFSCDAGYSKIASMLSSTTVTNANCCQPSCATFTACPVDYNYLSTYPAVTPSIATCCQQVCGSSDFSCDAGYSKISSMLSSTIVTNANCCQPSCATFTGCQADYNYLSTNAVLIPSVATCCQQVCGSLDFQCNAGYSKISSMLSSTTVTNVNCCQPSCVTFTGCPADYNYLSTNAVATPSIDTCCQQLCGSSDFSCDAGYTKNQSMLSSSVVTNENCCQPIPTCETFTCPDGYIQNFDQLDAYPASTSLCCTLVVQTFSCASVLGTCNGTDVMVNPTADYVSYDQCCQPAQTCAPDTYNKNGICVPCQWDIINPPNDAIYNWCRCNCYVPGTSVLNSGVCWVFGNGPQNPPIQECQWVCTGNEAASSNGTMTTSQWVDSCIMTPQCDSNCYTCEKTNAKVCTSCKDPQVLTNGKCLCANGKPSVYGVC